MGPSGRKEVMWLTDEYKWIEIEPADLQEMLGEIAYLEDENIAFKCGSPSQCAQCARCGKC